MSGLLTMGGMFGPAVVFGQEVARSCAPTDRLESGQKAVSAWKELLPFSPEGEEETAVSAKLWRGKRGRSVGRLSDLGMF